MNDIDKKKKFLNDEFVSSEKDVVTLHCDDGEGMLNMYRTDDGDIYFKVFGTDRTDTVRVRMSGSSIDPEKKSEIVRTIYYLMSLLEGAYDANTDDRHRKLLMERKKGNW